MMLSLAFLACCMSVCNGFIVTTFQDCSIGGLTDKPEDKSRGFYLPLNYTIYVKKQPFSIITITRNGLLAFGRHNGTGGLIPNPGMQLPTNTISFPFLAPFWGDFLPSSPALVSIKCPQTNYRFDLINQFAKSQGLPPATPDNILLVQWNLRASDESESVVQLAMVTVGQATMVVVYYNKDTNPSLPNIVSGYQYNTEGGNYLQYDSSKVLTGGNTDVDPNFWVYMISTAPCPPVQGVVSKGPAVQCPTTLPSDFCVGKTFGPHQWMSAIQNFIDVTCSDGITTCRPFCPAGLVYNYICNKCVYPHELGCTASLNDRVSCSAADQQSCTNRGCCWDRNTCFFKTITSVCTVAENNRNVCPGSPYERHGCLKQGCCWDPTQPSASQCYQSQKQLDPTWSTECDNVLPPIPNLKTCQDVDPAKLNAFCALHKDDDIYHYPMQLQLREYIQCDAEGRGFCRVCPIGLVFNQVKRVCDWPQNIYRP